MSDVCATLHEISNARDPLSFPFSEQALPANGIYTLFERGETAHGTRRIVRIGSHRGAAQLIPRLQQHFVLENKDRSIFRKNIGRAFLHRDSDPFLEDWNLDLTSREMRDRHADRIDSEKQEEVERRVTEYIQRNFRFAVFDIPDPKDRKELEPKMIGTVALCGKCGPSEAWLGLASPHDKIRESGLWQTQHLTREPLTVEDLEMLWEAAW